MNVYEAELFLASSFDIDITQKKPWCWFVLVYFLHHPSTEFFPTEHDMSF